METPPVNPDPEAAAIEKIVRDACSSIGEHVDSVRIFITHSRGSGRTARFTAHAGNWYASFGQIHDWLTEKSEETREQARRDMAQHNED